MVEMADVEMDGKELRMKLVADAMVTAKMSVGHGYRNAD